MITPRKLTAYCSEYYARHNSHDDNVSNNLHDVLTNIFKTKNVKKWKINYEHFLENIIEELILEESKDDPNLQNEEKINELKTALKNIFQFKGNNEIVPETNIKAEFESSLRYNGTTLQTLLSEPTEEILVQYITNLKFILENGTNYLKEIKSDKKISSNVIDYLNDAITMLNKWGDKIASSGINPATQDEKARIQQYIIKINEQFTK